MFSLRQAGVVSASRWRAALLVHSATQALATEAEHVARYEADAPPDHEMPGYFIDPMRI